MQAFDKARRRVSESEIGLHFGALCPPLAEQIAAQGLTAAAKDIEHWQLDDDAISRLYLRGLISDSVALNARKKLMRAVVKGVHP